MSGEAEKWSDEEHEVWKDRAGKRIGGVVIQAVHLCFQLPGSLDCLWVSTDCRM